MSKVLVVTGGSRGIGASVARLGAAAGHAVAVNYHRRADAAAEVVATIEAAGGKAIAVQADVGRDADVIRMFAEVDARLGTVDALVNNAGIIGGEGRVDTCGADSLNQLWATNITSAFICSREAILRMSTAHGGNGGAIVNVSSLAGKAGGRDQRVHYAASKGALNTFTIGLAKEVAGEGIRVNAVLPGMIDTDIHDDFGGQERLARFAPTIPMGRVGMPDEIGHAVIWLLSEQATYAAGGLLEITGAR